ncbi:MAG: indoleacetamide hydrolase [Aquabacterium sp.]
MNHPPSLRHAVLCAAALLAGLAVNGPAFAQAADPAAPIAQQAAAICAGRVSSEALVAEAVRRAKAAAAYNAFIHIDETGSMQAARAADVAAKAAGGKGCKPLLGVPIVVKDNIHVAGQPATGGTPGLKDHVPAADAPVVRKLREAGAIIIAKTQLHELAFGISGWNPAFQTGPEPGVRNAYDRSRSSGGSSAGTGVALGLRVVAAGLGTDTGGSVRVPCAFNGCASLRPTVKRYSADGVIPISRTRDTIGPMALDMADVELLDRVIAGGSKAGPANPKKLRLGLVKDLLANQDADTQAAFDAALAKLKAAGVTLVDVDMPDLMKTNGGISFPIALYEAYDDGVAYLARYHKGVTLDQVAAAAASPDVKGTYQGLVIPRKLPGPNNTLVDAAPIYEAAMKTGRPALVKLYAHTFRTHRLDGLVFPTVPKVAMAANPESSSVPVFMGVIQNTDPGSNAGVPGVQVPIGLGASSKLPIGLEIDGPAGSDRKLLGIGLMVQSLVGRLPAPTR